METKIYQKSKLEVVLNFVAHIILAGVSVFVALVMADAIKQLAESIALTA